MRVNILQHRDEQTLHKARIVSFRIRIVSCRNVLRHASFRVVMYRDTATSKHSRLKDRRADEQTLDTDGIDHETMRCVSTLDTDRIVS